MCKKTVLVTGSSKGIGRETALTFGREGYNVALNYFHHEDEAKKLCEQIKEFNVQAEIFHADVSKYEDLSRMYNEVIERFGFIDVVVNNAGISDEVYLIDATEEMFDTLCSVDWKGVFFSTQFAAKHMIKNDLKGVVINISSNQVDGCWPRATIYAPMKAAVSKFTKNSAMELASYGIRVVGVAPGYTDVGWDEGDHKNEVATKLPLKRFASTNEIAQAVLYLASDNASYITGTTLKVDGGATLPVYMANDF